MSYLERDSRGRWIRYWELPSGMVISADETELHESHYGTAFNFPSFLPFEPAEEPFEVRVARVQAIIARYFP